MSKETAKLSTVLVVEAEKRLTATGNQPLSQQEREYAISQLTEVLTRCGTEAEVEFSEVIERDRAFYMMTIKLKYPLGE